MALHYNGVLPRGALVRVAAPSPHSPAPVWFAAEAESLTLADDGRARRWQARGRAETALAVAANRAGTRFSAGSLQFEAETNCGFLLADAVPDRDCVSLGLIYRPVAGDARTLLTIQGAAESGYIFLDAQGDQIRLAQKGGTLDLSASIAAGVGAVLALCTLSHGTVKLSVNGGSPLAAPVDPAGLRGPADLFIGCRGARAGLRNKLGGFGLTDVLIWPGTDCLGKAGGCDAAVALWTDRLHRGV